MAKKAGAQQLQADIQNDEDLEKFLERPGLLVLDVYSEWCGPCLGMVGSLRKVKLEIGGDNLHLAIVKSEHVTRLKRFCRKSEPTWLFVTEGKAVNIYFGTNVPILVAIITKELKLLGQKDRVSYNLDELQPIEAEMKRILEEAAAETARIETAAKEMKRIQYLTKVTDSIMENMPDIGITIFGPQVNRDMFKKLSEPADALKIQCKDRRMFEITEEMFDTINFKCNNALTKDVQERFFGKEVLVCFWKAPTEQDDVARILLKYARILTSPRPVSPDDPDESHAAPLIVPIDIKVETEVGENEPCDEPDEPPPPPPKLEETKANLLDEFDEDEDPDEDEGTFDMVGLDLGINLDEKKEETAPSPSSEIKKKRIKTVIVRVPPIWVPNDHRTHAAMIYTFFRNATTSFLPPDPKPEPPHIIMAFDMYKKRDLLAHVQRHKEDVPLYGFFTSDEADSAKYITNSEMAYAQMPHAPTDKIVFKVNKATSNTMLSLVTYGPSYVSPNTVVGAEEAKKFFPENYTASDQDMEMDMYADYDEYTDKADSETDIIQVEEDEAMEENKVEEQNAEGEYQDEDEMSNIEDLDNVAGVGDDVVDNSEAPPVE